MSFFFYSILSWYLALMEMTFRFCWSARSKKKGKRFLCSELGSLHRGFRYPSFYFSHKGNQPWIFIERADVEAEAPILWPPVAKNWLIGKDPTLILGKIEGGRRAWQRMRWLDGIIDSMDLSVSMLQERVKDTDTWCAAVLGVSKSRTRLSDWTIKFPTVSPCLLSQ